MNKVHTEAQKRTLTKIDDAHKAGKTHLKPGDLHIGKSEDHVYLATKHGKTGKTHHVAIHKNGEIEDPHKLHNGKFDPKHLMKVDSKKVIAKSIEDKPKKIKAKKSNIEIQKPKNKPKRKIFTKEPENKPKMTVKIKKSEKAIKDRNNSADIRNEERDRMEAEILAEAKAELEKTKKGKK